MFIRDQCEIFEFSPNMSFCCTIMALCYFSCFGKKREDKFTSATVVKCEIFLNKKRLK